MNKNQSHLKERIYSPTNRAKQVLSLKSIISDFKEAGFLGRQLFTRDVKGMFRQSFLGVIWAFIPPFFTAAAWAFLNSSGAIRVTDTGMPYPIYVLTGTVIFQTLTEVIKLPADVVKQGKSMLVKLNFPRESLLISAFLMSLFNFGFKLFALVIVGLYFGISFSATTFLFLPAMLCIIIIGMGVGVILVPFQLLYTDFSKAINLFMQVVMYLTPVVYAYPKSGFLLTIVKYNPLTPLVMVPRSWFSGHESMFSLEFFTIFIIGIVILLCGLILYRITMPIIIERAGS